MPYKNIEDRKINQRKYYNNNKTKRYLQKCKSRLKTLYNITTFDYETMFQEQKGLCKICNTIESKTVDGIRYRLAVDHCHITGKVRGLLCTKCNRGLGFFLDSPIVLTNAIQYLIEGSGTSFLQ